MNAKLPYKKPVLTKKEKPMFEKHHEEKHHEQQKQQSTQPQPPATAPTTPTDSDLVKAIESKAAEYDDPRLSSVSGPSVAAMLRSLIAQHVPAKE